MPEQDPVRTTWQHAFGTLVSMALSVCPQTCVCLDLSASMSPSRSPALALSRSLRDVSTGSQPLTLQTPCFNNCRADMLQNYPAIQIEPYLLNPINIQPPISTEPTISSPPYHRTISTEPNISSHPYLLNPLLEMPNNCSLISCCGIPWICLRILSLADRSDLIKTTNHHAYSPS